MNDCDMMARPPSRDVAGVLALVLAVADAVARAQEAADGRYYAQPLSFYQRPSLGLFSARGASQILGMFFRAVE